MKNVDAKIVNKIEPTKFLAKDFAISKINRAELWCDLYYRIIIDLDSDEET